MAKIKAKTTKGADGWIVWASDCGGRGFIVIGVVATLSQAREALIFLQS